MKLPKWYTQEREQFLLLFAQAQNLQNLDSASYHKSPSGSHLLTINKYPPYTQGTVTETKTHKLIADIKRNHETFWFAWVNQGVRSYLLCGEDTQGYSVIDLQTKMTHTYIDQNALEGLGFRWLNVTPSPDGKKLLVEGCYFTCPKVTAIYDFSSPIQLPLPKINILDNKYHSWYDVQGWLDNETLEIIHDKETKKYNVVTGKEY